MTDVLFVFDVDVPPGRVIEALTTGEGIEPAVEGVEVIVHLAGGQKGDDVKALNLVRAASRVGAPHLVYI